MAVSHRGRPGRRKVGGGGGTVSPFPAHVSETGGPC